MRSPFWQKSRSDLVAELQRLEEQHRRAEAVAEDLRVHKEELRAQQRELEESHQELCEARDRYAQLFDFAPVAYIVFDMTMIIREANLSAAQLLGVERSRLLGTSLLRYVQHEYQGVLREHVRRCLMGQARVESEVWLRPSSAPATPVQLTSAPASSARVRVGLFHTALVDLGERKRIEAEVARTREEQRQRQHDELVAQAASDAKDRFLAMLSHELRTPLNPILFALASARNRPIPESLEPTLALIERNVLLEKRLIDDLLDMTRIVQGKLSMIPEVVDLHELMLDVAHLCGEDLKASGAHLTVECGAHAHHAEIDPVRIRQVLWNLINNSIRNTHSGGLIRLESGDSAPGWIRLTVSDDGRGIDAAMMDRIFSFFEQDEDTRRRGLGLGVGLPISKAIVEAHGGRIRATSKGRGRGTTISVEVRAAPAPAARQARISSPRTRAGARRRILLVEDSRDSAAAVAEFLRLHGYDVQIATCVREALDLAHGADILISDIALPDGTGHELMEQISAERRIPGVAISGYGSEDDVRRSSAAGFVRHIVKPVDPAQLLAALEALQA
ncbi:MAG: ATP-binding protein [Candidatus Binatia bacterium]